MAGEQKPKTVFGGLKAFSCKNCGGQVQLNAPGQTLSAVCSHCNAVIDLSDENFAIISKFRQKAFKKPVFEIGSFCEMEGRKWKLIGFMVRKVFNFDYFWDEYLLFNPRYGFRFLVENQGHWTWVKPDTSIDSSKYTVTKMAHKGKSFKRMNHGQAVVHYAEGEFSWRVRKGDTANTVDLIDPPYMISGEIEHNGVVWSLGEHISPGDVKAAFGNPEVKMPKRKGVGAVEPNRPKQKFNSIKYFWLVAVVALIAMDFGFNSRAPQKLVLSKSNHYPNVEGVILDTIELNTPITNLNATVTAPHLYNNWMEVYLSMQNLDSNGLSFEIVVPVEYYAGVAEGESWSEGATRTTTYVDYIPNGRYEVSMSATADAVGAMDIKLVSGITDHSNLLWFLLIISALPLFFYLRSRSFEKRRWANAD